jgi:hypothetical protein
MKMKYFLMTAAIVVATSSMAMAEQEGKPMDKSQGQEQTFAEKKARMLENMSKRSGEMQQKMDCVKAAADHEAMKACFPHWKERGEQTKQGMKEHMMKRKHMGGDQGGTPDSGDDEGSDK